MSAFGKRLERLEALGQMTQRDHEIEELAAFYGLPIAEVRAELAKHERLRRDTPIPAEAQVRAIAAEFGVDPGELAADATAMVAEYDLWRRTR